MIMAPAAFIDEHFSSTSVPSKTEVFASPRTLLLSPPSLSSHPERLDNVVAAHDRNATDIQMLDRLSLSLVSLPQATYDIILILLDADDSRTESKRLLNGDLLARIVRSLKPGGKVATQDGSFGRDDADERKEAVLAGLMLEGDNVIKPNHEATQSVPLRFGKKKSEGGGAAFTSTAGTGVVSINQNGKRTNGLASTVQPTGVGFVDFSDDLDTPEIEDDDDELIDEDTLLDEEDMKRPVMPRESCLYHIELCRLGGLTLLFCSQPPNAVPKRANAVAHAKTAHVA